MYYLNPNNKYGSNLKINLNFLYVLNLFLEFVLTLLSSFRLSVQFCLNLSFKQYLTLHTKVEDRICNLCKNNIEDEVHFLITCPLLEKFSEPYIKNIKETYRNFSLLSVENKLIN
jgi:hypothetical protein